jgi:hypothetical protein
VYIFQAVEESKCDALFKQVEMAIEILEIMEESIVAVKAAKVIQTALAKARQKTHPIPENVQKTFGDENLMPLSGLWEPFNVAYDDPSSAMRFQFSDMGGDGGVFEDFILEASRHEG